LVLTKQYPLYASLRATSIAEVASKPKGLVWRKATDDFLTAVPRRR
jgi:hypothetical protein